MSKAVALVADLMFASKISVAGRETGVEIVTVRSGGSFEQALAKGGVRLALVDMDAPSDSASSALRQAAQASIPSIAFLSHVRDDLAEIARQARATLILPRSRFTMELPDLLTRHCLDSSPDS